MSIGENSNQESSGNAADDNSRAMPGLNLPSVKLRLKRDGDMVKVYDSIRGKFVRLTPEEYVRQHFVEWLIGDLHYPKSHIANEIKIDLNGTTRRCDTVVFSDPETALMIVEYKAPGVAVTQDVFDQIVRYNMVLKAKYLVVSNGINHYCCAIDYTSGTYHFIPQIPDYLMLLRGYSEN